MLPRRLRSMRPTLLARLAAPALVGGVMVLVAGPIGASASGPLTAGNLLVSTSVWTVDPAITAGVTQLPPGCGSAAAPCVTAQANGTYPAVFNNDGTDANFGVTQPIVLDQLTPSGTLVSQTTVPNSTQSGITSSSDQMVTSFSSKSELSLNQSTDGNDVTFMGYDASVGGIDVSNSNTPGVVDPTNSDSAPATYRTVAQVDQNGNFSFTNTNAFSGNNGRAAVLNPANGSLYLAGNAGNGTNPEPSGVVSGAGTQILSPAAGSQSAQTPGSPTPLGNFNIKQLPANASADKSAKDNNYRGLTVNGNVVYYSKGSGSNGINTVYFVDTTGTACPGTGVGLPSTSATLPAAGTFAAPAFSTANAALGLTSANPGLAPTNLCILNGFPTALAKNATNASDYPFGMWFANPTTLYVADEGSGDNTYSSATNSYTNAAASTTAGLQKWTYSAAAGKWVLDYTLQSGLGLGHPYTVSGYPTGNNTYTTSKGTVTGPWAPATDGLRNLTGQVNPDGTVSIWATTSTVSFSGDNGADPNSLVSVTDNLAATTAPAGETFSAVMAPTAGQVVRGVSFTPGTGATPPAGAPEVPWMPLLPLAALGTGALVYVARRRSGIAREA